jgi:hypothetical protein
LYWNAADFHFLRRKPHELVSSEYVDGTPVMDDRGPAARR